MIFKKNNMASICKFVAHYKKIILKNGKKIQLKLFSKYKVIESNEQKKKK